MKRDESYSRAHFQKINPTKIKALRQKIYVLTSPLVRFVDGRKVTVPAGFCADGASGPGIDSIDPEGWWVHDWLYATHRADNGTRISRPQADSVMKHWHRRTMFKSRILSGMFNKIFSESGKAPIVMMAPWFEKRDSKKLPRSIRKRILLIGGVD